MRKNIILCGTGGQGTVLASRLISAAAMAKGLPVHSAETIGMAQRGGSVFSHLRLGKGVDSPMIALGEADLILGFEPGETVRMLPWLKEGGQVVVSSRPVMPVTATLSGAAYSAGEMLDFLKAHVSNLLIVDAERALREVGSPRVLNVILLGAALETGALGLSEAELREAVKARVPEKHLALNLKALAWYRDQR